VDVECNLKLVNYSRVSDPRRAFRPAFGVPWISGEGPRSVMGVIVISLGIPWSVGENFGCTLECLRTNAGITSKCLEMPRFISIFMQRTAGVV